MVTRDFLVSREMLCVVGNELKRAVEVRFERSWQARDGVVGMQFFKVTAQ